MINVKRIIFLFCFFSVFSVGHTGIVEYFLQYHQEGKLFKRSNKTTHESYFQQLLDHNYPDAGTFSQRYSIDETYGLSPNSPVFFYICGEAACSGRVLNGAIRYYAKKFKAKLVALEHRYYGESIPFNSLSTHDLRYLSTHAALEDLAYFQRYLSNEKKWTGKWIAFGGSYPGSLSAYYRLKSPDLIVGALASSAPVMAKEDFIEYDAHVTQRVGLQCANQMREVVNQVESSLSDASQFAKIKSLFEASDVENPVDFLYLIADTAAAAVQYGMRETFCASLSAHATPIEGYADFAKKLYKDMNVSAVDMTVQGAMSESASQYKEGIGVRQWYYQSCKEYGYWQNAHPNPKLSTRSSLIDMNYHHNVCQRLFGLSAPANTKDINNFLYVPLLDKATSNIYFTNGENDPWLNLSLTEKNGNTTNSSLTYYLIQGAAHCDDLHAPRSNDNNSLIKAREIMESLLTQWLT